MMGRLLGLNSEVFTFNELHFFEELWNPNSTSACSDREAAVLCARLINVQHNDYIGEKKWKLFEQQAVQLLEKARRVTPTLTTTEVFRIFLQQIAEQNNKKIACDQTPRNVYYLKEILAAYPEAFVINMVRDPRAVMLSQKNRWKIRSLGAKNFPVREVLRSWINYHPVTTSFLWKSAIVAGSQFEAHPRVRTIRYEDFVEDPSAIVPDICSFIGIDYSADMLNIPEKGGGTSSFKRTDTCQHSGIDSSPAYRWKQGGLTLGEIVYCQAISGGQMARLGYSQTRISPWLAAPWVAYYGVTLPIQLALAFILNFRRHRSIIGAIRRRLGRFKWN